MNPGTGGVIQRRARPRPNDCTLPAAASESSARCTVRWLVPSASARAELDHDSPSARKASTAACSSSTGRASTTTSRARRGASAKPSLRRAHVGQRPKHRAKPPDLDSQPRAMRFIGELRSEGARDERVARDVSRPRFAQRAREREQHRTPGERDDLAPVTHDMTASVHDEGPRRQQRLDLLEQEGSLLAARNQARSGRVQDEECALDLRRQRRDTCAGALRARPARAQRAPPSSGGAASRFPRPPARGRSSTREGSGAGSSSASVRSASSRRPIRRRRRTSRYRACAAFDPVAVLLERRPRRVERLRGPAQVARDERDLGLGDDAPRAGHGLLRTEGTRRPSQESLRANEIAELRHRDASQRESRRVVAQGDPLQCAEGIARRERARRGRDQRVHRNPVTLVTPTVRCPALSLSHDATTGQTRQEGRDDERTENRRSGRPGDGRQPRHRASADGGAAGPGREEGLRHGAQSGGAARPA